MAHNLLNPFSATASRELDYVEDGQSIADAYGAFEQQVSNKHAKCRCNPCSDMVLLNSRNRHSQSKGPAAKRKWTPLALELASVAKQNRTIIRKRMNTESLSACAC